MPDVVVPLSQKSRAVHGLRDLIVASTDFQFACRVDSELEAMDFAFITWESADLLGKLVSPCSAVVTWPKGARDVHRNGALYEIEFVLCKDIPKQYRDDDSQSHANALTDFENFADAVVDYINFRLDSIGSVPVPTIVGAGVEQVSETTRSRISDDEDRIWARYKAVVGQARRG